MYIFPHDGYPWDKLVYFTYMDVVNLYGKNV